VAAMQPQCILIIFSNFIPLTYFQSDYTRCIHTILLLRMST